MKKHTFLLTTLMASLFTFANVSQAGPYCDKKGGYAKHGEKHDAYKAERKQKRLDRIAAKLDLSEEQKAQFKALKQTSRNEMKPLRNEQRAIRKEIRQLDPASSDYSAKLADAANRQAEITRQMIIIRGSKRQQMATILTPEQLTKKKEMRANRKGSFRKRMHNKYHRKQQQS